MSNKLVVIEDEADLRNLYIELLESTYDVIGFEDGEAGLNYLKTQAWDLLLLDIMLPKLDGIQILTELKQNAQLANLPVILLTNLEKDEIFQQCLALGASGYLIKSNISPEKIVEKVNATLDA